MSKAAGEDGGKFGAARDLPSRSASAKRGRLLALIREKSLKRAKEGAFRLASGRASPFYFDMKPVLLDPEGANLIADSILRLLAREEFDFIGGLAMGAIPIVGAVCTRSLASRPVSGFFVRPSQKERGTEGLVEGNIAPDARVVLVEDVTTTGGSALKAAEAVWSMGCTVVKAVTIVDRLEGAKENLKAKGIELVALYTREDFGL